MPLTRAQFAEEIKRKFPQYQSVPDNQLVDAVLTKYPQYRGQVHEAQNPEAQKTPLPGGTLRQFLRPRNWSLEAVPETYGRELGSAGSTLNPINIVKALAAEAQAQAQQGKTAPFSWANIRHGLEGPGAVAIDPVLRSLGALGDYRKMSLEQALSVAPEAMGQGGAQALMMRGPINKLAAPGAPPIEPGLLLGTMTRSRAALDMLEQRFQNASVDSRPAQGWADRAFAASQAGYTLPKPISNFLDMMQRQRGQLTFAQARTFEKSLGERIPWEGQTKVMEGFMEKMREALGRQNAQALDRAGGPGTGRVFEIAKAQYEKGAKAQTYTERVATPATTIAGGELARHIGLPWWGGSALGAAVGRYVTKPMAGALVRSITGIPEPLANIPAPSRVLPFAAGFAAPFKQPPQDEEGQ